MNNNPAHQFLILSQNFNIFLQNPQILPLLNPQILHFLQYSQTVHPLLNSRNTMEIENNDDK